MALHRRDYILRLIEVVAAAVGRIVRRRQEGDVQGAREELAAATKEVLGTSAPMVAMVDARTAADLLSDPERIALYSQLLELDANLRHDAGENARAAALRRRALEMLLELVLRNAERSDDMTVRLRALANEVDAATLGPRYRDAAAAQR